MKKILFIFLINALVAHSLYSSALDSSHPVYAPTSNEDQERAASVGGLNNDDHVATLVRLYTAKKTASYAEIECLNKNIAIIEHRLAVRNNEGFFNGVGEQANKLLSFVSLSFLKSIFLVVWFLFFIFLFLYWFYNFSKKLLFIIVFCVFFVLIFLFLKYHYLNSVYAITYESTLKFGPSENFHDQGVVVPGKMVKVLNNKNSWFLIQVDGRKGWLPNEKIKII